MTARPTSALTLVVVLAVFLAACAPLGTKTIDLPPDPVRLTANSLPGYAKAQANCVTCHSAEYMLYQPPTAPRPYWDAMVKRMKVVFKAPINDSDMPDIVDYLV